MGGRDGKWPMASGRRFEPGKRGCAVDKALSCLPVAVLRIPQLLQCGGLHPEAKSSAFSCAEVQGESRMITVYLQESQGQMIVVGSCWIF